MNSTRITNESQAAKRPPRDYVEVKRRQRLSLALIEIGDILRHRDTNGAAILEDATLLVAEVAILDRVAPDDDLRPYFWSLCQALDTDPWGATVEAWERALPAIADFQDRWAGHQKQAILKSEPSAHRHRPLVDLEIISQKLGLTRPVLRSIFGTKTTSLPPIRMVASPFSNSERAEIRTLARRLDFRAEHLRDLALVEGGEIAFCDKVLARELLLIEQDRIDAARIDNASDLKIARHAGKNLGKIVKRPGPKPKAETIGSLVAQTAKLLRVSPKTVRRELDKVRKCLTTNSASEISVSDAELSTYYRGVDHEFVRSVIPTFTPSSDTGIAPSKLDMTAAMLDIVREAYQRPKTYAGTTRTTSKAVANRRLYDSVNVEKVQRWWRETRGQELTMRQIWNLGASGTLYGYVLSANLWEKEQAEMREAVELDRREGRVAS